MCLIAVVMLVGGAPQVSAADPNSPCSPYAGACASHCGTTVTDEYQYSFTHYECEWDPILQVWLPCQIDVFNFEFGSGVESFECDDLNPEDHICMCTYR
jgi:hypothetical protein